MARSNVVKDEYSNPGAKPAATKNFDEDDKGGYNQGG